MKTLNIKIADWCEENSTVEVTVESESRKETFFVQTTEGKYRSELGCWLICESENDGENIDWDDYQEFDFYLIIEEAEEYLENL